jgi:serine/arginine repetitive matrix protein 2
VTHAVLTTDVQAFLDSRQQSRPTSPTLFHLPLPGSRPRSYTNPLPPRRSHEHLVSLFEAINAKYRILWECAELLIELGGGASVSASATGSPPPTSVSAPTMHSHRGSMDSCRKNRERTISLAGDETKPTPNHPWTGSTGRNDLSQRQMSLLKEMMGNVGDSPIPEEPMLNREWRWGDAMSSTVTLPSEESEGATMVPKRSSKLGMRGLRDMLKSLVRSYTSPAVVVPPTSSVETSTGTDSSLDRESGHLYDHPHIHTQRRLAKASHDPESMTSVRAERPASPHHAMTLLKQKSSPRRPSLASIFRFGQKSSSSKQTGGATTSMAGNEKSVEQVQWVVQTQSSGQDGGSSNGNTEEDWDQMDSTSDLEAPAVKSWSNVGRRSAAVRGKSPHPVDDLRGSCPVPSRNASGSQASSMNVEEGMDVDDGPSRYRTNVRGRVSPSPSPSRSTSRKAKARHPKHTTGTLARPASPPVPPPPPPLSGSTTDADACLFAEVKVAVTPENIRPLLENAREVLAKLRSCNGELRLLLSM